MSKKSLVIIPTYNEASNIDRLISSIFELSIANLDVLVVDDSSPDGTADLVRAAMPQYAGALLLQQRPQKSGIGSAYVHGFEYAIAKGYAYVFEMDADFSHDPKHLPALLALVEQGYDLAIGSRRVDGGAIEGWGWKRIFMSRMAMDFSRVLLGLTTKDVTAGFRCYAVRALQKLDLQKITSNGYAFQEEMIYWFEKMQTRIIEIPITFVDRRFGKSKLSIIEVGKFFIAVMYIRWRKIPYKQ